MKTFSFLLCFLVSLSSFSQNTLDFRDTTNFTIFSIYDTIDVNHVPYTPYPNTTALDVNCDGINEINIDCFPAPVMNLPSVHNIEIKNLLGDKLEFAADGQFLEAFRTGDTIYLDSIPRWTSAEKYRLLYFHVLSGAQWAGIKSRDSQFVTNMNLLYRIQTNLGYHYGWLQYSGKSWPAQLYVHRLAIDRTLCDSLSASEEVVIPDIKLHPSPISDQLFISLPDGYPQELSYTISRADGTLMSHGKLYESATTHSLDTGMFAPGLYIIRVFTKNKIFLSKKIVKI